MAECSEAREQHTLSEAPTNYSVESKVASVEAVPPGYRRTEVGVIPEDWNIVSVKEIGSVRTGPFGTTLKAAEYSGNDGVPLISVGEIREGYLFVSDATPLVPKAVTHRLPQYVLKMGDIVFGRKGGVERSARIGSNENGWFLGSDGILLRPSGQACSNYLAWQFSSNRVQSWLLQNAIGTTMASLNQSILQHAKIPLAPTETEQRAIATALSDAEALIEALERLIAKKRSVKQAAMQQLLTGQTRLPGFAGGWERKRLGEVALFHKGSGLSKADMLADGVNPCIHYGELFTQYGEMIANVKSRTNREAGCLKSVNNDVLMPTSDVTPNGLATASCITKHGVILGGDILIIRPNAAEMDGTFLAYKIRMDHRQIMQLVSGTTVFHIYGRDMANFIYEAPAIDEQRAIVSVLSDMDAEIEALEHRCDKVRQIKEGMMQQLLTGRVRLVEPEATS